MRLASRTLAILGSTLALTSAIVALPARSDAQLIVVGLDEKVYASDAGALANRAPGNDAVVVLDIANREAPRIVGSLPLMNSIFGPPVNLQITPDERLAIVANSVDWVQDGANWKAVPDDKIYVIDLKATPPKLVATVRGGKQPSGLSINARGDMALVTNRADNSITVLSITGDQVAVTGTVAMGEQVSAVAITADGKRAIAVKNMGNKAAVLDIAGRTVTYGKHDMPVGIFPYNVDVTPDGALALTANNGAGGSSDGNVDTVSVIDLQANPPRVIDHVVVGDAPEGFAISPTGKIAVAILLNGSAGVPKDAWFANKSGKVAVLKIDGKKVTKTQEIEVGGLPEGVVFSPDGGYLYVGNFTTKDISILKVDGTTVTDTGKRFALPGQPASMRGRAR